MENSDVFGSSAAPLTWHDFLERMRHPSAAEFVKSIKSAAGAERDSASVQEFLSNMEAASRAHPLWTGSSEEELESAGTGEACHDEVIYTCLCFCSRRCESR